MRHISSIAADTRLGELIVSVDTPIRKKLAEWNSFFQDHPLLTVSLKVSAFLVVLGIIALSVFIKTISWGAFGKLPAKADLANVSHYLASEVYAEDRTLLGRYYFENRSYVKYKDISPHFVNALLATEDARFFSHGGVDLRSWFRVFFKTILLNNRSSGGGSTITQQLAKNLYPRVEYEYGALVINKLREVLISRRLERLYEKEEILELYLNTVPFSENTFGIKVAAQRFFNVEPSNLSPSQAAVLVAMLKATSVYNPVRNPKQSTQRRNLVLDQMRRYGYLERDQVDVLKKEPLNLQYSPLGNNEGTATYFREHLRLEIKELLKNKRKPNGMAYNLYTDGLKIYTTLDARMQEHAEDAMQTHMAHLQQQFWEHLEELDTTAWETPDAFILAKRNSDRYRILKEKGLTEAAIDSVMSIAHPMDVFSWENGSEQREMSPLDSIAYYMSILNSGLLAMDPTSGAVKAWVGGINHSYFKYDHIKSKRQVGSTFKPIVYAKAIQSGIRPCSYVPNVLRTYARYDNWMPKNADNKYGGLYSMEGGLINSVNTVTVNLAMRSTPKAVAELAMKMGIDGKVKGNPSIALGAIDASLLEMVQVYGTFANRGLRPEMFYIQKIVTPDGEVLIDNTAKTDTSRWNRALAQEEADMIRQMLQKVVDRGTARRLRYRYNFTNDVAGKTGTSQNHSDGWFIGFNPELVVGVWVGADSPGVRFRNLRLGQGANTALPVFAELLKRLNEDNQYERLTNLTFPEPPLVAQQALNCVNVKWPSKKDNKEQAEGAAQMGNVAAAAAAAARLLKESKPAEDGAGAGGMN